MIVVVGNARGKDGLRLDLAILLQESKHHGINLRPVESSEEQLIVLSDDSCTTVDLRTVFPYIHDGKLEFAFSPRDGPRRSTPGIVSACLKMLIRGMAMQVPLSEDEMSEDQKVAEPHNFVADPLIKADR